MKISFSGIYDEIFSWFLMKIVLLFPSLSENLQALTLSLFSLLLLFYCRMNSDFNILIIYWWGNFWGRGNLWKFLEFSSFPLIQLDYRWTGSYKPANSPPRYPPFHSKTTIRFSPQFPPCNVTFDVITLDDFSHVLAGGNRTQKTVSTLVY